jgi:1-pyrroline-5-carboxylate dehydrogenase
MPNTIARIPKPENEQVPAYLPGSPEKVLLKAKLDELQKTTMDIPLIIAGKEVRTGRTAPCIVPHHHSQVLATCHLAGEKETAMAVQAALDAKKLCSLSQSRRTDHRPLAPYSQRGHHAGAKQNGL